MKGISDSIATELGSQGIIQKEDIDKCRYGLEVMISSLLEVLSILIISVFVGNFLETFLLFAAFIPLRIYAGGYHANTKLKCYLVSVAVYMTFTVIMNALPKEFYLLTGIISTLFSLTVVFVAAPIIHYNKKVNDIEKMYYRKFSIIIAIAETMMILITALVLPVGTIGISLAIGQLSVSLSMLAALLKQKLCNK